MTVTEYAAPAAPARPGWREENRQDRLIRAQIERDREAARAQARIAEREASARVKLEAAAARSAARAAARDDRAARLARLAAWANGHVVDLLFVPVIGVPALLSWTAMSAFGARLYGTPGRTLPAFSEGAMWAFAAAVTLTLHRHPGRPVWHLRTGIVVFALFGAALNYVHGLALPPAPGLPHGPVTGAVMAVVSVAGVTAHQLVTAGPRKKQADAPDMTPDGQADSTPATATDTGADTAPARTAARAKRGPSTAARVAALRTRHPDMSAADMAARLGISDRTVRRHLSGPAPTDAPSIAA